MPVQVCEHLQRLAKALGVWVPPTVGGTSQAMPQWSAQQLIADGVYLQVCEHLQRLAKPLGVWVAPIVGGISQAKQARLLGRQPQVKLLAYVITCQNCARSAIVSARQPTREI